MCGSKCLRLCKDSSKLLKCCKPGTSVVTTVRKDPPLKNMAELVPVLPKSIPVKPDTVIPKLLLHNIR